MTDIGGMGIGRIPRESPPDAPRRKNGGLPHAV